MERCSSTPKEGILRTTPKRFTESEDGYIRANYHAMLQEICKPSDRGVTMIGSAPANRTRRPSSKRWCDSEDAVIRTGWGKRMLADVARNLTAFSEVSTRESTRMHTLEPKKRTHAGRPMTGLQKTRLHSHRKVVEERIEGRFAVMKLFTIDGNKFNNASGQIFSVFNRRAAHRKAHATLESNHPCLLLGVVEFDRR